MSLDKLQEAAAVHRLRLALEARAARAEIQHPCPPDNGHCAHCGEQWPCTGRVGRLGNERRDVPPLERARHTRK